jgi:hypothetical protein
MRERSILADLLLSCGAAVLAGGTMLVLTGQTLAGMEPRWAAESVAGALTAIVWMVAGLYVAKSHHVAVGAVLYCLGVAAAWVLARGVVHSTSAYYGLFQFSLACLGGAGAWLLVRRRARLRSELGVAIIVPLAFVLLGLSSALLHAPLGVTRRVSTGASAAWSLPVVRESSSGSVAWYVWSPANADLAPAADSTIYIELDPGSGSVQLRVTESRDASDMTRACTAFREQIVSVLNAEIAGGAIPGFMKGVPIRYRACEKGRVWLARG